MPKYAVTRALTISQPWAWLIVRGFRPVELRSWRTNYRCPIAVHAGISQDQMTDELDEWLQGLDPSIDAALNEPGSEDAGYPIGGMVGVVEIVDCLDILAGQTIEDACAGSDDLMAWRDAQSIDPDLWLPEDYAGRVWLLDSAVEFTEPLPCTGRQSLWNMTAAQSKWVDSVLQTVAK